MGDSRRVAVFAKRERKGSEKRQIGILNIQRMLPGAAHGMHGGNIPPGSFSGDTALMAMEDSYCDMWDRDDIIDHRTRSLFNVALMIGVGNVSNQFELGFHAPGAIYNGATVAELEAMIMPRAYVGSPCAAHAMMAIVGALTKHELIKEPLPEADVARKERTGSEKRKIAKDVLRELDPASPVLHLPDELPEDAFAPELQAVLENMYFDLWARAEVLSRRDRSVVTLGLMAALENHRRPPRPCGRRDQQRALRPELEELVYQASTTSATSGASRSARPSAWA